MADFLFRTEDLQRDEILRLFVETKRDRSIVDALKARNPVILVGSRGVGKSFLLRVAEAELLRDFEKERVLPVYLSFNKSSLLHTANAYQFQLWMIARVCTTILRTLNRVGLLTKSVGSASILSGDRQIGADPTKLEKIADAFEGSWQTPGVAIDTTGIPSVDEFKNALEDLCDSLSLRRIAVFVDEAAHILIPEQQRQFFTLYRDLRSAQLTCNAAIYPGVTAFGDAFQPVHDATVLPIDRDILATDYTINMREIVEKQADSATMVNIARNGQNFSVLAYAATGNPRILLKTIGRALQVSASQVNEVIRSYYRSEIWSEHSLLGDKYPGHQVLVDWGRKFIEQEVLPELYKKNVQYLQDDKSSTCFFWLHRDAPEGVKAAIRLLSYTGIVVEHSQGIKATRGEIGIRYQVNLGCLFALEATPAASSFQIARSLTPRRMSEYGANHAAYQDLLEKMPQFSEPNLGEVLAYQLGRDVNVLDITDWQIDQLKKLSLNSIGDVLRATEDKLQEAHYVGEIRARRMRNAAVAAVYEYLSG